MSGLVTVLLLLSALLSALSGAGVQARAPQVAVAATRIARVGETAVAQAVAVRAASRPVDTVSRATVSHDELWHLAPSIPARGERRLE